MLLKSISVEWTCKSQPSLVPKLMTLLALVVLLQKSKYSESLLRTITPLSFSKQPISPFSLAINSTLPNPLRWLSDTFVISAIFYLILFVYTAYDQYSDFIGLIFILSICMFSDTGGFIVGKLIGGKKLTEISPNKTISGSLGSFLFSLLPLFFLLIIYKQPLINLSYFNSDIKILIFISLFLSFVCQSGDLFISYFKRKAKVKDTGSILPGHGGLLDRIDGAIFVIPVAFMLDKLFF